MKHPKGIKFPFYRKYEIVTSLEHSDYPKYRRDDWKDGKIIVWEIEIYGKNDVGIFKAEQDYFDRYTGKPSTEMEFNDALKKVKKFLDKFLNHQNIQV